MTQEYEPLSEAELVSIEARLAVVAPKEPYKREIFRFIATIRDLQGQVEGLTAALGFYTDAGNFEVAMFDTIYETTKQGRSDFGTRAKQALEGKQEG